MHLIIFKTVIKIHSESGSVVHGRQLRGDERQNWLLLL
ncbi:hypothetical protein T01_9864 [Trichinella spiralis]|uniref:Uncharacterized protein n=1 Tax=Trichinella spiralis TaxID=6334 RepID=A0A0V1AI05_TRISP|nr:hypothetical protein T01_9864 [Trichinella spiralis]